jgi:hypothetical protein
MPEAGREVPMAGYN